jgi:hypothetical protein
MDLATALFVGVLCHMVGDYLIQNDWMAGEKTKRWTPAIAHAVSYGLPFLVVTWNPWALLVIVGTHAVIDRYRLARHVCWLKNQTAPKEFRQPWSDCKATGYGPEKPPFMAVWLMIIADNTMHVAINSAVIFWLYWG